MIKKIILRLLMPSFFFVTLYSCIHDDVSSASEQSSKEYTNKSLWKEDEKYIKNVMKVYQENEDKIKKVSGTPFWDYAVTLDSFDETFVMVPIVKAGRVVSIMQVPRNGTRIHFYYTTFQSQIDFFQALIFAKYKKVLPPNASSETDKSIVCKTVTVTVWLPDNESNPDPGSGSGHWGTHSVIKCKQVLDNCSGVVGPDGQCITGGSGGDPGGYPYPGGGGETPETPEEDLCQKTKNTLQKAEVQKKIAKLKDKSKTLGEQAFLYNTDGTTSSMITGNLHQVDLKGFSNYNGIYHNHTPAGIKMLAPPDILSLFSMIITNPVEYSNEAFVAMVGSEPCNCPPENFKYFNYIIRLNGNLQDAGNIFNIDHDVKKLIIDYEQRYMELKLQSEYLNGTSFSADLNEKGLEKLFFDTLKNININPNIIVLQKVEESGEINTINLNNNGTTTPIPCL
jgi:hypothetical protein